MTPYYVHCRNAPSANTLVSCVVGNATALGATHYGACVAAAGDGEFGQCSRGYICTGGAVTPTPENVVSGGVCDAGTYCRNGSSSSVKCLAGYYNPNAGQESCSACPAGFYCPQNDTKISITCPAGYFCPALSYQPSACPEGAFSNVAGLKNMSQCSACSPGMYCSGTALVAPTGLCNSGFTCLSGSVSPSPSGLGWKQGEIQALQAITGNAVCPAGSFCESGSVLPVSCPAGTLRSTSQARSLSDCLSCNAGRYCAAGSVVTGTCPLGFYCTVNATVPLPCPPGTFGAVTGLPAESSCTDCPAGRACLNASLSAPNAICVPGYFCPQKSTSASPSSTLCPVGHFCPVQSGTPIPCPPGKYQDQTGQSVCAECLSGYFCSGNATVVPQLCLPGFYCPAGTPSANAYPCPVGRFSASSGLRASIECSLEKCSL